MTTPEDPRRSARAAGLRYVDCNGPGYTRREFKHGFSYFDEDGHKVRDEEELERIQALAVPPAWEDVWICPDDKGHLQATGYDDQGRKQYIYHERWHQVRGEAKFQGLLEFGHDLPALRERIHEDLHREGLPKEKVVAAAVELMDRALLRVGNDRYAQRNESFGLVTLRDRHVDIHGSRIELHYTGKGQKEHEEEVQDPELADVLEACHQLPGQRLFEYEGPGGEPCMVRSGDVNAYIREATGHPFTSKEFRTWGGTVHAAALLHEAGPPEDEAHARKQELAAIERVAEALGNTPRVAEESYIHPGVLEAHRRGELARIEPKKRPGLREEESLVLDVLEA